MDGIFIPTSISNTIHYYLLSGASEKDLVYVMDREKVFFFIKYMLEKRFGRILSMRFTVNISGEGIVIRLTRIQTDNHVYEVDGRVIVNPYNSSINLSLTVKNVRNNKVYVKKYIEDGVCSLNPEYVEIKYYV